MYNTLLLAAVVSFCSPCVNVTVIHRISIIGYLQFQDIYVFVTCFDRIRGV